MQGNDFKDSVIVYVVTEVTICISRLPWQLVNLKRTVYLSLHLSCKSRNVIKQKRNDIQAHQLLFTHPNVGSLRFFVSCGRATSQTLDFCGNDNGHKTSCQMLRLKWLRRR